MSKPDNWGYKSQNGVVVLTTNLLNEEEDLGEPRVYITMSRVDPRDPHALNKTTFTLNALGFKETGGYVPMSFDGGDVAKELIKKELESLDI